MKNLKEKRMLVVLLSVAALLIISTNVFATDLVNPINILTNTTETNTVTETNTTVNNTTVTPTVNTTTTTNTATTNTTLPQTGDASDYAIFAIIAVAIIISVYAYKKVRDYNKI